MTHRRLGKLPVWGWLLCLASVALPAAAQPEVEGNPDSYAFIRIPQDTDDWTRHFRLGAMVGMNISAHFSMNAEAFSILDPSRGIFGNGYVRPDQSGGPYTGYWGFDNPSQYNPGTGQLAMQANTSFSVTGGGNADVGGSVFPGLEMAYGDNLWYWKHARVGWEFGFGWLPIFLTDKQPADASVTQSTFIFNVGNIVMPGAGTPYQGTPGGDGEPIIPVNPNPDPATTNYTGTVTGSHTLSVSLYTFRLGPSFYWDLTKHFGMSLGGGPAVGIVDGDYKYDETITASTPGGGISAHNQGTIHGTEFVYGAYVSGALMYHVVDNGDIFVGAQYMPMSDATIGGGGREGRLNLGGQLYFSVGINWPF